MGDLGFIHGFGRAPGPNPHWESLRRIKKDISGKRNYIWKKNMVHSECCTTSIHIEWRVSVACSREVSAEFGAVQRQENINCFICPHVF